MSHVPQVSEQNRCLLRPVWPFLGAPNGATDAIGAATATGRQPELQALPPGFLHVLQPSQRGVALLGTIHCGKGASPGPAHRTLKHHVVEVVTVVIVAGGVHVVVVVVVVIVIIIIVVVIVVDVVGDVGGGAGSGEAEVEEGENGDLARVWTVFRG